jgi:DNA-directed RNA polymerase specialized sigma24 family protein
MIPDKIDSRTYTKQRENGLESIVGWFDQHRQSFYTLGWCYLRNQQALEELFFQSILKVQKEFPRFTSETSYEIWVTSIFIHTCRELSTDRSFLTSEESKFQQFFKALDQLNMSEKESVALTYIQGFDTEEVAQLLQVSVARIKELLFSGIQALRRQIGDGSIFNGCKEYHKEYIDYLEKTIDRSKKIDFEVHLYHCQDCQADLSSFQDIMFTLVDLTDHMKELNMPPNFIESIKDRLVEKEKHSQRKTKKRKRIGFIFAGIFALLMGIGFYTGMFSNLYYAWVEENKELRPFLQKGLGERLNLETENNGVKITIKSVIADDVQTLVFYKIEDTDEDNQFVVNNFDDGLIVENEHEIMSSRSYPRYYPPDLNADVNTQDKNVFHGKISLLPLRKDSGIIKLKITKLHKLIRDSSAPNGFMPYGNIEYETGEWNFELPVTKQSSAEYELDGETEVEGILVQFDKLIVAPTATILQYTFPNDQPQKRIEVLNFDHLVVNKKRVKASQYGYTFFSGSSFGVTYHAQFSPLFGEIPKDINIQLESAQFSINDQKIIELDASGTYPQTFDYAGSTISIDRVEVGEYTNVVISNHEIDNRSYESLHFSIVGEDENYSNSMEMDTEGVLVDKNGVEYDVSKNPVEFEKIEQPRYFVTVQKVKLQSQKPGEKMIPKRLEIYGYNAIKYLDEVVEISLP